MKRMSARHLMVLIAMSGLSAAAVGILTNTGGLFFTPIAEDMGVGRGDISMTMTIANIVFAVAGMLVPRFLNEKRMRPLILTGSAMLAGGTLLCAACQSPWQLYLVSALRGFGGGLVGFVTVTTLLNQWFVAHHGTITSLVLGFSGLTGAVLSPIITNVILSSGWRTGYAVEAVLMALCCLPAILLPYALRPDLVGLLPYGGEEKGRAAQAAGTSAATVALAAAPFLLCVLYALFGNFAAAFPPHFLGYALSRGYDASVGAVMMSAVMVANIAGKLLIGSLSDRIGTRNTLLLACGAIAAAAGILLAGFGGAGMTVGAFLFGFAYGLAAVGPVLLVKDICGMANYGKVYPTVSFVGTIVNALAASLYGFLYDVSGAYAGGFIVVLASLALTAGSLLAAYAVRRAGSRA